MRKGTIGEYVTKAIQHAVYEYCEEIQSWCGYVRELPGCWAQGDAIEATRLQLIDVIEGWLILALQFDDPIPPLDGLTVGKVTQKKENARGGQFNLAKVPNLRKVILSTSQFARLGLPNPSL